MIRVPLIVAALVATCVLSPAPLQAAGPSLAVVCDSLLVNSLGLPWSPVTRAVHAADGGRCVVLRSEYGGLWLRSPVEHWVERCERPLAGGRLERRVHQAGEDPQPRGSVVFWSIGAASATDLSVEHLAALRQEMLDVLARRLGPGRARPSGTAVDGLGRSWRYPVHEFATSLGVLRVYHAEDVLGGDSLLVAHWFAPLNELVGTGASYQAEEITELLRSIVSHEFGAMVARAGIRLADLSSKQGALSEQLRAAVRARVDDEYGLDIPQLFIVNISVPEEVEKALDARSSIGVVGNLAAYQAYQVGRSTPIAAANPAGGVAGAGVGLGMGLAYAQQVGGAGPAAPTPPATPPPIPALWHVATAGRAAGPYTMMQLAEEAAAGRVAPATLVWTPGMAAWAPAASVADVASLFGRTPPPLPPGA